MKSSSLRNILIISCSFFLTSAQATELGQITVADPTVGSRTIVYEKINGYALVEGDILLGKIKHLNRQSAIIALKLGGSRWPNGIVPYEISEDLPFENKLSILQAIDQWQKKSQVQFVELTSANRDEYYDYISFVAIPGLNCSSYVGRKGGKQIVSLSTRCNTMFTAHELGHVLGFWHEHSRADRNSYIRIIWENIKESYRYNFSQHITDGEDFGEYDYLSIMHYGPFAFTKNGKKTIIPLVEGVDIGQREQLSVKDIEAINAMYP
jgi:hypothetical protein